MAKNNPIIFSLLIVSLIGLIILSGCPEPPQAEYCEKESQFLSDYPLPVGWTKTEHKTKIANIHYIEFINQNNMCTPTIIPRADERELSFIFLLNKKTTEKVGENYGIPGRRLETIKTKNCIIEVIAYCDTEKNELVDTAIQGLKGLE